jgi:hypothetical protein
MIAVKAKKCSKSAQNLKIVLKLWTVTSNIFVKFLKSAFLKSGVVYDKKREREKVSVLIFPERRARVLIPPGYSHPGKRKH